MGADEVVDATLGTVKVQYVKLMDGTLDGTSKALVGANGLAVDVKALVALPAGTNNIGDVDVLTLPALPAGTNNIGDVDVLTINGVAPAFGTGVRGATVQRVTIATDDSVPVTGTFWQATQPVSGSLTVDLGANNDVTVTSGAITETNSGGIQTAVQLIDDVIYVDDADWTDGSSKHALVGGLYQSTPQSITDGDVGPLSLTSDGALRVSGGGGGTEYTEDAAAAANPVGTALILVRTDTPATQVGTDGDNVAQRGTNYGAAYVQLVTSSGAYIDSVGGGTEYTEDVATANPIVGKAIMVERDDALSAVTPIEGDNIGLRGTAEGALWTQDFNSDAILVDTTATKNALETVGGLVVNLGTNNDVTVTSGSITETNSAAALTALQLIDNAVSGAGFNITQLNGAAVPIGAGVEATALRVTIANNSTGVVSIDDNGGIITVDGTVAVTGVATAANQATIIGHIDGIEGLLTTIDADTGNLPTIETNTNFGTVVGGGTETGALRVTIANNSTGVLSVDDNGSTLSIDDGGGVITVDGTVTVTGVATLAEQQTQTTALQIMDDWDNGASDGASVSGDTAHDAVDAGEPVKIGYRAIAHGTNPTAVAAADRTVGYANRAGVPFVIGGHPNVVTFEAAYTAAQTDTAIVTIAGGLKIVVTEIDAICDTANTVDVGVRVGFGAVNTPTTTGVVLTHPGISAGSGVVRGNGGGILGVGADGADLRITCTVPTTGSIRILVTYYTIES